MRTGSSRTSGTYSIEPAAASAGRRFAENPQTHGFRYALPVAMRHGPFGADFPSAPAPGVRRSCHAPGVAFEGNAVLTYHHSETKIALDMFAMRSMRHLSVLLTHCVFCNLWIWKSCRVMSQTGL
jgi:hypothetical protein